MDLQSQIDAAYTTLAQVRADRAIEYKLSEGNIIPADLKHTKARIALFTVKLLPLIVAENDRIRTQRKTAQTNTSTARLNALAISYNLKPKTRYDKAARQALLKRIDVIPESLVLAQAGIESAWGTSRFARKGNAFFGERTYDPNVPGIKPKRATGFKVKSYPSPAGSIRSYMRTLNTHKAYTDMRAKRAELRARGQKLNGSKLVAFLGRYSELGDQYTQMVQGMMSRWQFGDFDGIALSTH